MGRRSSVDSSRSGRSATLDGAASAASLDGRGGGSGAAERSGGGMLQMLQRTINRIKPEPPAVPLGPIVILLVVVVYGVLFFSMGNVWLPGSPAFATGVIWVCSLVGGHIAHWLRLPRVVGMLGVGILLANVPGGVVAAFPKKWGVQMRAAALATIFLRCGLELEFKTMALYKWPALRLALVPGLVEAVFDAGIATAVFGMPFTLALSLGFILKAVGPGLVVPAMFQLQKQGLGSGKGIPSTVVIAASFDDIIAITGFSIFICIAVAVGDNAAWQIASGPLQVLFGMAGGCIAGVVLGWTRVFDTKYKRFVGLYGSALLVMFFLEYFDLLSGGALGALTVGLVACYCWERGLPHPRLSLGPSNAYAAGCERVLAHVWNWVMEPLLFATIGVSIVFSALPRGTVGKAVLVVVCGVCLRVVVTYLAMGARRYTWRERLFFAVGWTPKATVQASLSAVPLALINRAFAGSPELEQWQAWGNDILATGIFAIIICASLGTAAVYLSAPRLLAREAPEPSPLLGRESRGAARAAAAGGGGGGGGSGGPTTASGGSTTTTAMARAVAAGAAAAAAAMAAARTTTTTTAAAAGTPTMSRTATITRTRSLGPDSLTTLALPHGETITIDPAAVARELRGAEGEHSIINAYFDSIDRLVGLVMDGRGAEARDEGLCAQVLELQEAIAHDVGPQEMTVRQMLHSAALRARQPAIPPAAADELVRMSLSAIDSEAPGSIIAAAARSPRPSAPNGAAADDDVELGGLRAGGGGGGAGNGSAGAAAAGGHPPPAAFESVGSTTLPAGVDPTQQQR